MKDDQHYEVTPAVTATVQRTSTVSGTSDMLEDTIRLGSESDHGVGYAVEVPDAHTPASETDAHARFDVVRNAWTIFSTGRQQRPQEFIETDAVADKSVTCPFCVSNSDQTPPPCWVGQISRTRDQTFKIVTRPSASECADTSWNVRVVPNKYPAVSPGSKVAGLSVDGLSGAGSINAARSPGLLPKQAAHLDDYLFPRVQVVGGHDVVIESRHHTRSLTDISAVEAELVFLAYRDRMRHYRRAAGVNYISVFKNVGQRAGASLGHSHSQVLASSLIPPDVQAYLTRMQRHRASTGCCLMCDLVREEFRNRERIIASDAHSVAYCPFASRLPMKVRVTTKRHQACFEDLDDDSIRSVSRMVYRVIGWLEQLRPGASYNYCLNTKPVGISDPSDAFHWWIDIFPRITQVAGFEWAGGSLINPILPEDAARQYRYRAMAEDPRVTL